MGLDAEAVSALQTAADGYHKEGKKREALELLRKMAQLDPSNTTSRLKVAELLRQEGLEDEAADEFEAVAEELQRQGEVGEAEKVFQRLVELRPDRVDILVKMARSSIETRRPERAETWARKAVDQHASEETLEVLCDVYKALERTEQLIDATKQLAALYRERGDEDMARTIMQRLPSVEIGGDTSETAPPPPPDETDETLIAEEDLDDEEFLADDGTDVFEMGGKTPFDDGEELEFGDDDDLELDAPAPTASLGAFGPDATGEDVSASLPIPEGDPDQLLAEASVYMRYGKTEQAIASLRGVLADEPGHRGALEKLGEALCETGDTAGAVDAWSNAAERAREEEDFEGFDVLRGRIEAIDAEAASALGEAQPAGEPPTAGAGGDAIEIEDDEALFGDDAPPSVAEDASVAAGADEIEIDFDLDEGDDGDDAADDTLGDAQEAAVARAEASSATQNGNSSTTAEQVQGELEEAEFYYEQGMLDEAAAAYERVLEVAPNHPSALLRIGEIAAARGDDPAEAVALGDADATMPADDVADDDTLTHAAREAEAGDDDLELAFDLDDDLIGDAAAAADDADDVLADEIDVDLDIDVDVDDLEEEIDVASAELPEGAVSDVELGLDLDDADVCAADDATAVGSQDLDVDDEAPLGADELQAALEAARATPAPAAVEPAASAGPVESAEESPAGPPASPMAEQTLPFAEDTTASEEPPTLPGDDAEAEASPLAAAADEHEDESFDLAAELSDALDDDDPAGTSIDGSLGDAAMQGTEEEAFASLFEDFKRGVSETLDDGDYETRYDLAIAYKEMGLLDDAISAFQVCVSCPTRGLDSLQLMAQCQLDAGRANDAIGHLEQALSSDELPRERRAGLYFDLARAFAAAGDVARARTTYENVSELDPSFPGVSEAVAELLEAGEGATAAEDAGEEAFESFDDIVAEATAEEAVRETVESVEGAEGAPVAEFESFDDVIEEAEEVLEAAEVTLEPEPEPEGPTAPEPEAAADAEPAAEAEPAPSKPKKKSKKISFV